jgi:hypothetical protein
MAKAGTILGMKFDNHVSIGHVFTTIGILVVGVYWASNIDNQISNLNGQDQRLEQQDTQIRAMVAETRNDYRSDIKEVRGLLKEISDKIDKKVDR